MQTMLRLALPSLLLSVSLCTTLHAHGGQYRGPGSIAPPSGGPSSVFSTAGGNVATPGGATGGGGPGTAAASGGGVGGGGATSAGPVTNLGMVVGDDLTRWEFWWELNKDPIINLRGAAQSGVMADGDRFYMGAGNAPAGRDLLLPTEKQILGEVLPALHRALQATDQRDIASSCMVSLAKIGKDTDDIEILPIFRERLTSPDQEIRETAALALGLSAMPESVDDLIALVADDDRGRKLCSRGEVDDRTRSFATYGLGLVCYASDDNQLKRRCLEALEAILSDDNISDRNIRVAAINAISLLRPVLNSDNGGPALFNSCVSVLDRYWRREIGTGQELIQAHCPPAIAKLYDTVDGIDDPEHSALHSRLQTLKRSWRDTVKGGAAVKHQSNTIIQSAIVALGRTSSPADGDDVDGELDRSISKTLIDYSRSGRDHQARYFALMALGQIGGQANRRELIKAFQTGNKALEKPWAALSLGVLAHLRYQQLGDDALVDTAVGKMLQAELHELKSPASLSALAVSLGLLRYTEAGADLLRLLEDHQNKDFLAGYICIGLGLMGEQLATAPIRDLCAASVRRPQRMQQAAIALGKLGDKQAADLLTNLLTQGAPNLARMSAIATALGYIADRRSIPPLLQVLDDDGLTDLTRAFAAVALGRISEKEPLPWNSKIAVNMNYRAAVETLTNGASGILDIL